jgi:sugar phosphate permease
MGVPWQGVFIYPAMVLTLILIWSYLASRSSPADVVPGAIPIEGESSKAQIADYGDEEHPPVSTIMKTLLRLPIYRELLVFSFLTTLLRSVFLFWTPKFLFDIGLGASSAILRSAIFPLLGVAGTVFIGWYTDHHARNGDRARMMWIMLSVLVFCMIAISVLSGAAGILSDYLGWPQVFMVLSVFAVISTLSAWMMSRGFQKMAREAAASTPQD